MLLFVAKNHKSSFVTVCGSIRMKVNRKHQLTLGFTNGRHQTTPMDLSSSACLIFFKWKKLCFDCLSPILMFHCLFIRRGNRNRRQSNKVRRLTKRQGRLERKKASYFSPLAIIFLDYWFAGLYNTIRFRKFQFTIVNNQWTNRHKISKKYHR